MEIITKNDLKLRLEERIIKRKAMFIPMLCISTFALVGYAAADTEAPVIESSKIEVLYGTKLDKSMLNITDNRDDLDTLDIEIDDSTLDSKVIGTYTVPVTATDRFSNKTTKNVIVEVVDKTSPVLSTVVGNGYSLNIEVNSSNDLKKYIHANDNVDGDVTAFMKADKKIDTSKLGSHNINVSVDDNAGNKTEKQYVVNVVDTTAPTIKLTKGSHIIADYGKAFDYKKYVQITDNFDKKVSHVSIEGKIDTNKETDQEIVISAVDSSNNKTSKKLTVSINDISAPKITLSRSKLSIKKNGKFNAKDYLVSAIDNKDGNLTSKVKISGSVNTKSPGKYTVSYSVSDKLGNKAIKKLVVTVKKPENPNAAMVSTAISKLGSPYLWGATGPYRFDCSGFTQWVYRQHGKYIPRTSGGQKSGGKVIPLSQAKPGDIVWRPGHVGIYVGGGRVIHAPHTGAVVSYTSASGFSCAVRY